MNFENKLVSKVVQSGGIEKLIASGVESRHFANPENQAAWDFLVNHVQTYRTAPEPQAFQEKFPEYELDIVTDPLEYVRDQFIIDLKRREATKTTREIIEILDENDREQLATVDEFILEKAQQLATVIPSSNVSKFSAMDRRIEIYKQRKAQGIQLGIPFGIQKLDELTLGLRSHQYVTIAGFTGIGKSTLGLILTLNHYLAGYTPMVISLEMDEDEIFTKLDGMAAELRQHALRAMELSGADVKRWEEIAERCEKVDNDIIVVDIDFATPARVYAETARWKPDVVVVDYVQLMIAPKEHRTKWEQVDYCSKMLKSQARGLKIPVYGLAQTNADAAEQGAKLTNLGGSKSIGFHSDLMLGLSQDDEMKSANKMDVTIEKNRTGPLGKFSLYWDQPASRFEPYSAVKHGHAKNN